MFLSNEKNEVRAGFVTRENVDDLELMNSIVQFTSFMTEYCLNEGESLNGKSPFTLLAISSCHHERTETPSGIIEEMKQLWHFARDDGRQNVQYSLRLL